MSSKSGIFFIISLLCLVGTVAAADPFTITITSSKTYLTAGYTDNQAVISVNVKNTTTNANVVGAGVMFSIVDASLGTFQKTGVIITDSKGNVKNTFISNTKSGIANIGVTAIYLNATSNQIFVQKIDHDKAHTATFDFPFEGAVGTSVTFNISFTDRWGNPIDQKINPSKVHMINLHVTGPNPDDCIFVGYGSDILGKQLDVNGNVSVKVRLTSGAGPNIVRLDSFEDIPIKTNYITAITTAPYSIQQVFNPDSPSKVPADGVSKFTILYSLYDKFGNPANQQWVWVNTSVPGDEKQYKTDNLGRIAITYGPQSSIGIINITATAVNNGTVTISHEVEFTSTAATTMVLTANPEVMASRDVNPSITTDITATITDISGNPVENENVTFSLGAMGYPGGPYNETSSPSLTDYGTVKTDEYGQATVQFIPGSFTTDSYALNYSMTATGNCTVTAHWNTTNKNILVTWKNYPYLSISTWVNPKSIIVNDTVDATIFVKGDGWALGPQPVDVVIITNLAGGVGGAERLTQTKLGENAFIDNAEHGFFISLVSIGNNPTYKSGESGKGGAGPFASANALNLWNQQQIDGQPHFQPYEGAPMDKCLWDPANWNSPSRSMPNATICNAATYNYYNPSSDAKLEMDFTEANSAANKKLLKDTIQNFNDFGGTNYAGGINMALQLFDKVKNNGHKKALIIMGDGITMVAPTSPGSTDSYWPSDWYPRENLGCFDESDSAKIAAWKAADLAKSQGIQIYVLGYPTYGQIDNQTINGMVSPGQYYFVPDANQMRHYFEVIYGAIREEAGVNTALVADFQNNNVTDVPMPGAQVYDYVYNTAASTKINWQDGVTNVTDQSAQWDANRQLNFNIGTIKINQTWQATFRLKLKHSGIIDLFGFNSRLFFNNGTSNINIPHTYLTVASDLNATGFDLQQINVISSCPQQDHNSAIVPLTWDVTYTGGETDIHEVASYIDESGAHVPFYYGGYHVTGDTNITRSTQFDLRRVPLGTYSIEVSTFTANNTASTSMSCGNYTFSTKGVSYINLRYPMDTEIV